jgi:hypothetical protein
LTQAVEYLHDPDHGTAALAELEAAPEDLAREAFAFHERRPPACLEIRWASEKIARQLLQGRRVTVFKPTGRRPLTWTVATKD